MPSSLPADVSANERKAERWFQIALEVPFENVDAATGVLASAGYSSCEIVDHEGARSEIRVPIRCDSLREANACAHAIEQTLARFDASMLELRELDERVWREDWKRHFKRTRIGKRLEIVPPWEADEAHADGESIRTTAPGKRDGETIRIVINPGLAFGTGHHETTAGCLELLDARMRPGSRVLDLGCGSAILAIAAAKLGAQKVVAVDNDPEAVNAARENTVLNRVESFVEVRQGDGPPSQERFDFVLANILADTLVAMAAGLTSCVNPGGILVLSGIESEQTALVQVAFSAHGWQVIETVERSGWVSLTVTRSASEGEMGR